MMWTKEVVVGHKKSGQDNGAVEIFKPASGSGVKLVGAIETFDELFQRAIGFAFRIVVAQADDFAAGDDGFFRVFLGIDEDGRRIIGGVAVCGKFKRVGGYGA